MTKNITKIFESAETRRNLHTHTHTCNLLLSLKQIGTICFAISILISAPTFARISCDNSLNGNCPNCVNSNLQTYSGTSNLQANWQANTIQLHWYEDSDATTEMNVASASQSCVYDGALTPPATIPTKTGYTFKGWRVRQICTLSGLNSETDGNHYYAINMNNNAGWCQDENGVNADNCSNSEFSDLNMYEWKVESSYGTVYGESMCAEYYGDSGELGETTTESELISAGEGSSCWCHATIFAPFGGSQCNITSNLWFSNSGYRGTATCRKYCAGSCARILYSDYSNLRSSFLSTQ